MTGKSAVGKSWLEQLDGSNDILYLYLTSFHWTLAQMTPGPINIVATNTVERAFNCFFLISGPLLGSGVISLVSGQIMRVIILRRATRRSWSYCASFSTGCIKQAPAVRIQRQVIKRLVTSRLLDESQVTALELLSTHLREELLIARCMPHILLHPLFRA